MKLYIGTFAIVDTVETEPDRFSLNGQENVQIAQYLRATRSVPLARGNTVTTIGFGVTRSHASYRAAMQYACTHHAALPKTGAVKFIFDDASGINILWLTDGKLASHIVDPVVGVSTYHRYTLVGGDFTTDEDLAVSGD